MCVRRATARQAGRAHSGPNRALGVLDDGMPLLRPISSGGLSKRAGEQGRGGWGRAKGGTLFYVCLLLGSCLGLARSFA